jgi:transcription elongation factor GreB
MSELPIYITREGYTKVKAELDWLWRTERPRVTAEVEAAAALGDRSENAEYQYGKRRLREIDKRMRFLSKRIERMKVVGDDEQVRTDGKIGFGAWVTIEDEDGETVTYRIVGADESDPDRGYISMGSPMALALLGKELDDEVEVRRPKGVTEVVITGIRYGSPPDADAG